MERKKKENLLNIWIQWIITQGDINGVLHKTDSSHYSFHISFKNHTLALLNTNTIV